MTDDALLDQQRADRPANPASTPATAPRVADDDQPAGTGTPVQLPDPVDEVSQPTDEVAQTTPGGPGVGFVDLQVAGGVLRVTGDYLPADEPGQQHGQLISTLPPDRMAAQQSWNDIAEVLRDRENGCLGADVEVKPGGALVITNPDEGSKPLSRLPEGRMAAQLGDVEALRRLDPDNVEKWTPMISSLVSGWTFQLRPPVRGIGKFQFLAFRNPSEQNGWRITPVYPNMDDQFGHAPHMINVTLGGQRIPVVCGPAGQPARDLAEVRTYAAKWMAYTAARMAGLDPGFSE